MTQVIRVLIVGKSEEHVTPIRREIKAAGGPCQIQCSISKEMFFEALETFSPEVILYAHPMPAFDVRAALETVQKRPCPIPLIVIVEATDEAFGIQALTQGAMDCLFRDRLARLPFAIRNALAAASTARNVADLEKTERTLRENEEKFRDIFDRISSCVVIYEAIHDGTDFIFKDLNPAVERSERISKNELIGKRLSETFPGVKDFGLFAILQETWKTGKPAYLPASAYKDTRLGEVWRENHAFKLPTGEIVVVYNDITERKKAEEAFKESEDRFINVMHASSDAILLIGDNTFIDCNETTIRMLGYNTREEVIQTHPSRLSPPTQPDGQNSFKKAEAMMSLAYERGFNQFEWIHRRANGEDFPVEVSLTPIVHQGKKLLYCVWRDITQRKKTEEELRSSQERLKIIFEYAPDGYYTFDLTGNFLDGNKMAEALSGYSRDELIGKSFMKLNLIPASQLPQAAAALAQSALGQPTGPVEYDILRKDGSRITAEIRTFPVKFHGKLMVLGCMRDITEHKKMQEEAQKRLREFEVFFKAATGREERILELKKRVAELEQKERRRP